LGWIGVSFSKGIRDVANVFGSFILFGRMIGDRHFILVYHILAIAMQ